MNDEILVDLALYERNPLGFVMWAFPWGEEGTELEHKTGPEPWQREILEAVGRQLSEGFLLVHEAVKSGHGVGKSALVSWLILWGMCTFPNTKGVVTANTEKQLRTKTWSELSKWFGLFIAKDLFELDATCLKVRSPEVEEKSLWKVDMIPWSERNTEAFAGLHNLHRRILLIMDEGSGIPDVIYEVSEGAMTDAETQILWFVFGNPIRNKGRFRDCFGKFKHRWNTHTVDSRQVSFTNKKQIADWIEDWGEDSDFVRVRITGQFPRVDADSFISFMDATEAVNRYLEPNHPMEPLILGVDVGRFGDDPTVICPRRGRDAESVEWEVYFEQDTMKTAALVAASFLRHKAAMVMVDSGGVGGGVADRLHMLRIPTMEVDFGSRGDGDDGVKYANKRAEIWGKMRKWLEVGRIPERVHGLEMTLVDELCGPKFGMNKAEELVLEAKIDMRRRGVKSPNLADALACTFAYPVYVYSAGDEQIPQGTPDYNPYERERMAAA